MLIPVSRDIFLLYGVWSFAAGILFGAIYDVFRIRRAAFRISGRRKAVSGKLRRFIYADISFIDTAVTFFEDILFFTFCAVTMILVNYKLCYGYPRWYAAAACVGGFSLYHVTVGRLVMFFERAILHAIADFFRFVKKYTVKPVISFFGYVASVYKNKKTRKFTARYEADLLKAVSLEIRE